MYFVGTNPISYDREIGSGNQSGGMDPYEKPDQRATRIA